MHGFLCACARADLRRERRECSVDAEDVAHDTIIFLLDGRTEWARRSLDREAARAVLRQIQRNLLRNILRSHRRREDALNRLFVLAATGCWGTRQTMLDASSST